MIISKNRLEPLFHLSFWALLFALTLSATSSLLEMDEALKVSILRVTTLMTIAYIHLFLLIPYFFRKRKFVWYSLSIIVLIISSIIVNAFIFEFWNPFLNQFPKRLSSFPAAGAKLSIRGPLPQVFLTFITLFFTLVFALGKEFLKKEQQASDLEREKIRHELNFLRTQINPHFLFNALNNLHATIELKPQRASAYVLKLGEMLRYVLEDCKKEKVKLSDEITYLQHFIFFQQQRDNDLQDISLKIRGEEPDSFSLEPMLLIALVENAFIHSYTEEGNDQFIEIQMELTQHIFSFYIKNNLPTLPYAATNTSRLHHIGLKNVSRRLELLYPDQHSFVYGEKAGAYEAGIVIKRSDI